MRSEVSDPYPSQSSARSDSSVPMSQIQATLDKYAMPPPVQDVAAASEDMQPSTLEILCELGEENFETQQEEEDIPSGQAWQEYHWNEFDSANADTLMDHADSQSMIMSIREKQAAAHWQMKQKHVKQMWRLLLVRAQKILKSMKAKLVVTK